MQQANSQGSDAEMVKQLRQFVQAIEMTSAAVLPRSSDELLQSIVEAAARIFGAAASSILLVDEDRQELVFKVAFNSGDENVIGMRTPMDKGIAGYVVMTGQPIAVSNVQQDSRFNREFAEKTGYIPRSILATPLLSGEKVIGVMEVLDKINATSFGMQDMEMLGLFAKQAAIAINQTQQFDQISESLIRGLKELAKNSGEEEPQALVDALELTKGKLPADLMSLAKLFNEISSLGEAERRACIQVLEVFRNYRRSRFSPR